jgi:hypothetical protein
MRGGRNARRSNGKTAIQAENLTLNRRAGTFRRMNKSGWLRCDSVERGMFSDEVAVVVSRSNGAKESYFVPVQDVERDPGRVRVAIHDSGSLLWATLPTNEPVTIPVSKSLVEMK